MAASQSQFDNFAAGFAKGQPQLVHRELVADTQTPVSAYLKLAGDKSHCFLLESVEGGAVRGRFSVIGIAPDLIWRCRDGVAEINHAPQDTDKFVADDKPPLLSLRALMAESAMTDTGDLPPMAAGLFGYFGYDMIRQIETIPDSNKAAIDMDDSLLLRPSLIAIFDRLKDSITLITQIRPADWPDAATAWQQAESSLASAIADLDRPLPPTEFGKEDAPLSEPTTNMTKAAFLEMVKKGKDYIRAGDVFQIVLSQRFSIPFGLPAINLYRSLRRLNPSPFLFHFDFGTLALVGSSPEILVRLRDNEVTIRPVAGTRKRGATPEEDAANAADLLGDIKERAEHLMLLDLGRNDVGRVAKPGSVRVKSNYEIEYYSHVIHISSQVEGTIRDDLDAVDALIAGFPAGTVSGAPKIRAMELIDDLEPDRRGAYAGAVGYISVAGDLDTCIALRTAVVKDKTMYVQAGAGVVYDSDPLSEYEETRNKARALIRAAGEALRFAR
ncbi:MAG: anthranilate synthase component I [Alphaproteobacteria bacterium]|nr:anthranilate synthase component I [Alphaproteobacteria bacterium]